MQVNIDASWKEILHDEFDKPYFAALVRLLKQAKQSGKTIYPPGNEIFQAFYLTPFNQVKVLIIGQDPYHGPQQAHGLCFSVRDGVKLPPSLVNIFKELSNDLQKPIPSSGDLSSWAKQGVLLLNTSLTVEAGSPMSHSKIGWTNFTDAVIQAVSDKKEHVVFVLWGKFAQTKENLIDTRKHSILYAAHPSPLSAHQGFFGCRHFSKINSLLIEYGQTPINF